MQVRAKMRAPHSKNPRNPTSALKFKTCRRNHLVDFGLITDKIIIKVPSKQEEPKKFPAAHFSVFFSTAGR